MKKILCIGEALIDMICTDTGKSLPEGQHFLKKPGGAPANVVAAIAALGRGADGQLNIADMASIDLDQRKHHLTLYQLNNYEKVFL